MDVDYAQAEEHDASVYQVWRHIMFAQLGQLLGGGGALHAPTTCCVHCAIRDVAYPGRLEGHELVSMHHP